MAFDIGSIVGEYAEGLRLFPKGSCYEICVHLKGKSKSGKYFHEDTSNTSLFGTITSISDGLLEFKIVQHGLPTRYTNPALVSPMKFAVPMSHLEMMVNALDWYANHFWMQFKLVTSSGEKLVLNARSNVKEFITMCSTIQEIADVGELQRLGSHRRTIG